ncbi:MAG: hypothetical protein NTU54_01175 [Candidatus Omnitrophica bacterium]|nr:hypothetical protein [Candidatus Omnitrophota bacterium]
MATIRELFHSLGNKHNIVTIGCGATMAIVDECLEAAGLPQILKDDLIEMRKNMEEITKEAMAADKITVEIHDKIYSIIDPDTGKVQ